MKQFRFIFLLLIWKAGLLAYALNGYINLDCGLPKGSTFTDELGYIYTPDDGFINSGEIEQVAPEFVNTPTMYQTLRSFPSYRRNCYNLMPVTQGNRYLVRASFMYGNYDGQNLLPVFDLYLGVEPWKTVKLDNASHTLWTEIIITANSSTISVCLVKTAGGIPFISGLELRPVDSLYNTTTWPMWLITHVRINAGWNGPSRFKADAVDRIWPPDYDGYGTPINTSTSIATASLYPVPPMVMQTAEYSSTSINIHWPASQGDRYHFALYFSGIIQYGHNQTSNMTLSVNGGSPYDFTVDYMDPCVLNSLAPFSSSTHDDFSILISASNGTSRPIISAIELYKIYEPTGYATYNRDYAAMMGIRDFYQLKKNWVSDPCLPQSFPWDGLNCSYGDLKSPTIISLDLSNSGLQNSITSEFAKLTSIQSLNLSGNNLHGSIPDFLANIKSLSTLDLSSNYLSGTIPSNLKARMDDGSLSVRLGNNKDLCMDGCHKPIDVKLLAISICVPVAVVLIVVVVVIFIRKTKSQPKVSNVEIKTQEKKTSADMEMETPPVQGVQELLNPNSNQFSYSDMVRITKNFQKEIGKGGSGTVFLGRLRDNCDVAVKKVTRTAMQKSREFAAEVDSLTQVHHRSLVSFYGFCDEGAHMMLIYEYMAGGNLRELLSDKTDNSKFLTWEKRLQIALSVATGLDYLHSGCKPPIIHRDVKTSNILLDASMEAKLSDFGLSKAIPAEKMHVSTLVAGTTGYIDPEYYSTGQLTAKSDVYSFGVVLFELITGLPVFFSKDEETVYVVRWAKMKVTRGNFLRIVDPKLKGQYDSKSVWRVAELAITSTSDIGFQRPTMTEVVSELKAAKDQEARHLGTGTSITELESVSSPFPSYTEADIAPSAR